MANYEYPALFKPNEIGGYCVIFPDIEGAVTEGKDLSEAMIFAKKALCLMLYTYETEGCKISSPTPISKINTKKGEIIRLISCNTDNYKEKLINAREKTIKSKNKLLKAPDVCNFYIGDTVRVYIRIQDGVEPYIKTFEGVVVNDKHNEAINEIFTVRKIAHGVSIERKFPLNSPSIVKVVVVKKGKNRRGGVYHLRSKKSDSENIKFNKA